MIDCVTQGSVWRRTWDGLRSTRVEQLWRLVWCTPVMPARMSVLLRAREADAQLALS